MKTTTQTDKAIQRPWQYCRNESAYGFDITSDNGRKIVAQTICSEHEHNAALIVQAVNEHAALVAVADKAQKLAHYRKYHEHDTMIIQAENELFEAASNLAAVRKEGGK